MKHAKLHVDGHSVKRIDGTTFAVADDVPTALHIARCVDGCDGINPDAVPDLLEALTNLLDSECSPSSIAKAQMALDKFKGDL